MCRLTYKQRISVGDRCGVAGGLVSDTKTDVVRAVDIYRSIVKEEHSRWLSISTRDIPSWHGVAKEDVVVHVVGVAAITSPDRPAANLHDRIGIGDDVVVVE